LACKKSIFKIQLIGSKVNQQVNCFITDSKYISNVSKTITIAKFETILPCTFDQALLSYFSNEMILNTDPNCARFLTTDFVEYEDLKKIYKNQDREDQIQKYKRDLHVSSLDFALPFPFHPRHATRADSCHYDPTTKTFIRVGKNFIEDGEEFGKQIKVEMCKKRNTEPKEMKAYSFFLFSATMYQQIDEKQILYKDIAMIDFGGWGSSSTMSKAIVADRKNKFKESILKMAKEFPENVKISDLREKLTKKVDGKVIDGFGTLLCNIDFE
jgi:hypothetical protein